MAEWTVASVERELREVATARRQIDVCDVDSVEAASLASLARVAAWLAMLNDVDAEIVRLRCSGSPWKPICWRLGMGRATVHRRWAAALQRIANNLRTAAKVPSADADTVDQEGRS